MQAARLVQPGGPVRIEEIAAPRPGPGQVLIRMEACGLCHSDLFIQKLPRLPAAPVTLGHEAVGVVEEAGPGADSVRPGERVGMTYLHRSCGACEYCRSGHKQLCPQQANSGYHVDGGFAEYAVADAAHLARVPPGLDPVQAAPLCCAGWTAFQAVETAGLAPGAWLAVHGAGGLGHLAIQFAKLRGLHVAAVDISTAKLEAASRLGADLTIDASAEEPRRALKPVGGVHGAICFAASAQAAAQAAAGLRRGGILILVGLALEDLRLPLVETVLKGLRIEGSFLGTPSALDEVFSLAAGGKLRLETQTCRLEDLPHAMEEMEAGRIEGRMVVKF